MLREAQSARALLLRERRPPRRLSLEGRVMWVRIMTELALIHKSPRLSGQTKSELFARGAKQLTELK
jgi:hypothetical protein